jgi:hypothetical protein
MLSTLRNLATRKIWRFPVWAYLIVAFIIVGALSDGGGDEQPPKPELAATTEPAAEVEAEATTEPAAEVEPAEASASFSDLNWEAEIDAIVDSDATLIAQGDEVARLAKSYSMTEVDIAEQTSFLVEQVKTRSIVDQADDKRFMYRLAFIARSIEVALDDADGRPEDGFANDFWQVARDLGREVESPDSSFIQANLDQLDGSISENGW